MTVQWRTAAWSLHSRGSRLTAGQWLQALLAELTPSGAEGGAAGGCVKVALIAQMKEDAPSQREVRIEIDETLRRLNAPGSPHAATEFVSHSAKSAFDATALIGKDDPATFTRDLALMATSHLLLVGESQLSRLGAALQPLDGKHAHLVADGRFYAANQATATQAGSTDPPKPPCRLLAHTILPDEALLRARRAMAAAKQAANQASGDASGDASSMSALASFIRGGPGMEAGAGSSVQAVPNKSPGCAAWAAAGECVRNPRFMAIECAAACHGADATLPLCPQYHAPAAAQQLLLASDTCEGPPAELLMAANAKPPKGPR